MSVCVRIAPSPTGPLHVGLARTALFNALFAMQNNGRFIMRMEDTDPKRSKKEYEEDIITGLEWLGLKWDAFHRQSDRSSVHRQAVATLLSSGAAYRCFCTQRSLDQMRKNAERKKQAYRYAGTCRTLSNTDQKRRTEAGEPFIVRLRIDADQEIKFEDIVRGTVSFPAGSVDDFVISRDMDRPLYHLAAVVDDAEMNITHVIRGEDHISNTPKHILIQRALGISTPQYAHIPLILDERGKKLSKRSPNVLSLVSEYRQRGYLPEALVNALALIGWNPKDDQELFGMNELVDMFRLQDVGKGGAILSKQRLDSVSRWHMKHMPSTDLAARVKLYIQNAGIKNIPAQTLERAVAIEQERVVTLSELADRLSYLSAPLSLSPEAMVWRKATPEQTKLVLLQAVDVFRSIPDDTWKSREALEEAFLRFADESGTDRGTVLWPVRYALCGKEKSPGPHELAWVLGGKETVSRLENAVNML